MRVSNWRLYEYLIAKRDGRLILNLVDAPSPAHERANVDWQSVNRILSDNADFHRIGAYSVRLSFLTAEIEHMEKKIADMVERANNQKQNGEDQKAADLWHIIKNTRDKQKRYRQQAEKIDECILQLLG